jgi:hypothetical protein
LFFGLNISVTQKQQQNCKEMKRESFNISCKYLLSLSLEEGSKDL